MIIILDFIITDEAKQILTNPIYKQIGIISLVGKYRTGKSFLLNRVLLNEKKEKGFVVGPTIKPCTKGIWMWSKPVLVENIHSKEKFYSFFIDTEGLGAYDEEINHDSKIFLIAILISSLFILNTFGNIDENAINSLSFIINLSKTIKLNQFSNESNPDELSAYFPSFLWLLRDFSLQLEDTFGNVITAKQYLENALQLQKGSSESIEEKNKIRKLITTYFKERDCFSMVRPIENEIDLQNLQSLDDTSIRKEFLDQAETLRNKVFKKVKPKIFNNKTLSGSMLIELLDNIIDAINKGAVPVIENSWKYMLHNESLKNMNICLAKFRNRINEFKEKNKENPNFFKDLKKFKDEMINVSIQEFKKESISSDNPETKEYIDKLKTKIQQEFEKFNNENSRLFENKLNEEIDKNFKKIYDVFETDKYQKNYNLLFQDLENLKELLETSIPDFKNKKDVINEKIINIIKKFIEVNLIKNKLNNEKEIALLKNENANQQNKLNLKNEEYEKLKFESSNQLEKLNAAYTELKLKEKTFEEKFGQLLTEKKKVNATADEKINSMKIEMNSKIEKLKFDLGKAEADLKNKDDHLKMAKFSEDKMNALNSQKLEYLEREILSYKERIDSLKYDNAKLKSTVEEQFEKIDELKNQLNKKSLLEMENERLKKDNENILMKSRSSNLFGNSNNPFEVNEGLVLCASGNNSNKMSSPTKMKNLDPNSDAYTLLELIKEVLNNQSSEQTNNLCGFAESVKNMVERISRENEEYIVLNKNLTENQLNFEKRYQSLESRYENLNYIKTALKQALTIQCKNCKKLIENETFINSHHNNCKINKDSNAFAKNNDKLRIKILKGVLHKDELGRPFIEYILEIIYNKQIWRVIKKFNQFANLHKSLKNMMNEDFIFPESANIFVKIVDKNNFHEDKIKQLESYVREISEIPLISNSKVFKRFFEFQLNHQDEFLEESPEIFRGSDTLRNSYKKSTFSKSGYRSDGTDSNQEEAKINNHNFNTFKNSSNYSSHRNNFYADSEGRITFENNNSAQKTKDWR